MKLEMTAITLVLLTIFILSFGVFTVREMKNLILTKEQLQIVKEMKDAK